jgi:hypothetical protein
VNEAGESQVKCNVPERTSEPRTASPITRQPTGSTTPNSPGPATWASATGARSGSSWDSTANSSAPAAGSSKPIRRFVGKQALRA